MRKLLLASAGLALLAPAALVPTALAQTPPAPGTPPPPAGQPVAGQPMAAQPPAGPGRMADVPPPPPPGGPRGRGGPGGPPPPPPRGAHVRIERGDARIDVKCADDDTTQACLAVVDGLLDKLAAMPPAPPARN